MSYELRRSVSTGFDDGTENCHQLVGFLSEQGQLRWSHGATLRQQFEPIGGFLQFLWGISQLRDKLGPGTSPVGFAIVRPHGGAGPKDLVAENSPGARFRQLV